VITSTVLLAQAVSRRPFAVDTRVRASVSPCGICGGQNDSGTVSVRVIWLSPVSIIPPWICIISTCTTAVTLVPVFKPHKNLNHFAGRDVAPAFVSWPGFASE
jgi:hypothetical protein